MKKPATDRQLLPIPRRVRHLNGVLDARDSSFVFRCDAWPESRQIIADELASLPVSSYRSGKRQRDDAGWLEVRVTCVKSARGPEWYRLRVTPEAVEIRASDVRGIRHASRTLRQLLDVGAGRIAAMDITDWPDFASRGVMLDISRDKIPNTQTLYAMIDLFASWKFNQLQLYTEHTFTYEGHERVWRGTSAMTPDQIVALDAYCRERDIELVPNQNSLGHMEHWLRHEPYRKLAETTGPWQTPWGETRVNPTTLCPIDPGSIRLMRSLYQQLLPSFKSRQLNVGCDEPWELGFGRSAKKCKQIGAGRVYLNYIKRIHAVVRKHGRKMQFWSDWLLKNPELVPELPRDVIPLIWGYEAIHPYATECRHVRNAGLSFYVCPGTSSWCSFAGRTTNMIDNIRLAASTGRRNGATGMLITDWGDYGHRQQWPVSYAGFALSAAMSWCGRSNAGLDLAAALDQHVFRGGKRGAGALWLDAGRVHESTGITIHNRSVFFELLNRPIETIADVAGLTAKRVERMEREIKRLRSRAQRVDFGSDLVKDEFDLTLDVLRHGCRRAQVSIARKAGDRQPVRNRAMRGELMSIMERHKSIWLKRNRRGGLKASLSYYRKNLADYA